MELYTSFHTYILKDQDLHVVFLHKSPYTFHEICTISNNLLPRALPMVSSIQTFCSIFLLTSSTDRAEFCKKYKHGIENIMKIAIRLYFLISPKNIDLIDRFQYIPVDILTAYQIVQDIPSTVHEDYIKPYRDICYSINIIRKLFSD